MQSGLTNPSLFDAICIPSAGCFEGLDQRGLNGGVDANRDLTAGEFVRFAKAISLIPALSTGERDLGAATRVAGDAQVQLVFEATREGEAVINLGTQYAWGDATVYDGGEIRQVDPIVFRLRVLPPVFAIPESGAALLMSSGLLVVAGQSRVHRRS